MHVVGSEKRELHTKVKGRGARAGMESKTYRTTSDVIVIYEANDTEERRGTALGGRAAAVHSRLVNPKKHKHDMGGKGGAGPRPGPGGGIIGRKEVGKRNYINLATRSCPW